MTDELIALCRPIFQPGTLRADVSFIIPGARIDLSANPIELIFDEPTLTVRNATETELSTILAGLYATPPHPQELTPLEILDLFTEAEQTSIETNARSLARRLFSATDPISWQTFYAACQDLHTAGILTSARFTEITGESA